ncbi:hypothetical protein M2347_003875 [Chryseobacterium sp. H1D6B]|nr:hypothetical protein [Chryseobacterium sp. H1D6B]
MKKEYYRICDMYLLILVNWQQQIIDNVLIIFILTY